MIKMVMMTVMMHRQCGEDVRVLLILGLWMLFIVELVFGL